MTNNVAHRGFSELYPENTMLSYKKALEAHCDGIELDVQLSKDGELVIIHDETLDRTTNGTGNVKNYTLKELKELDASFIFAGKYGINKIPTLKEYFNFIKDFSIYTNIEIKNSIIEYPEIEEKLIALIREYQLTDKVIISSFNHQSIQKCKKLAPEIKGGFITGSWIINAGSYTKKSGVEFFHPRYVYLKPLNIWELHRNGIKVHAWTVNEEKEMRTLIRQGIYGIITNNPARLHKVLEEVK
ncbi:MAG: glycerophosphodiester phosphodiesterase [Clostridiaceae bacterium]